MPWAQRLISRQLRKSGLDVQGSPEAAAFVALVEESYREFEKHRQLTDHSTRLASEELAASMQHLGDSERLFRSLARCSPNGIIHANITGHILYANERTQELTGRPLKDLAGHGWIEFLPPEDRSIFNSMELDATLDRTVEHRVIVGEGEFIWVSTVIAPLLDATDTLVGWVANIEDVTQRKLQELELSLLARHDSLTQLLNRHALRQYLEEMLAARTAESSVAIALIDLDRFKLVNDMFGHEVGDNLLIAVADRLRTALGDRGVAARLGGDEFAVAMMLDRESSPADLGKLLSNTLHGPVDVGTRTISLAASIGVAVADGRGGTPSTLLREADTAMYRAKRRGAHRYEVFDDRYRQEAERRLAVEAELLEAIDHGGIGIEFQPVFDSVGGQVISLAAQPRWHSKVLGDVPHAEFVAVVNDLALTAAVSSLLIQQACVQLATWRSETPTLEHLTVSCEISALQLSDTTFPDAVKQTLEANSLPGNALVLAVSESAILTDLDRTILALTALRKLGVRITLDDFGKGQSSLSYLDRLPVDYMKIDKAFVDPLGEGAEYELSNRLTETIISLAHRFGLTPLAEGVTTEAQGAVLRRAGCQLAQGHWLAEPMSAEDPKLTELLTRKHMVSMG